MSDRQPVMVRQQWLPDVSLHADRAAALITSQFPVLAPVTLRPLGVGWDNAAYVVNDEWVFRFPRRQFGAMVMDSEIRVLPALAPLVTLPVPVPVYVGRPEGDYPYPFAGYRMLAGTTACSAGLDEAARARHAAVLGAFLRVLHRAEITLDGPEPRDDIRRADMRRRLPPMLERLERVAAREPEVDTAAARDAGQALVDTPAWSGEPRWVHGDLYARHLVVDDRGALAGVIDWGDVHRGDPALDISIAISYLPPAARPSFRAAYGDIDADTWARARYRALHYGAALLDYGLDVGDAPMAEVGRTALRYALVPDLSAL